MAVLPRVAGKAAQWTRERVAALVTADVRQLRSNAENLSEPEIVTWCDEVLQARPKGSIAVRTKAKRGGRKLVSRSKAFELRGVFLQDPGWSRGGVRKADGMVVVTVWAGDISAAEGGCSYRLWSPNVKGSRAWSDTPGGQERLEHCRLALQRGEAEGLLVHGARMEGSLPDDKAESIEGVDPEVVVRMYVELRGREYWGTWGKSELKGVLA
jgi:hypothetical protein